MRVFVGAYTLTHTNTENYTIEIGSDRMWEELEDKRKNRGHTQMILKLYKIFSIIIIVLSVVIVDVNAL